MFEPYYHELHAFLTRKTGDRDTACDIVQESYTRALSLHLGGERVAEPRALLYRIAKNLLIDRVRQAGIREHDSLEDTAADDTSLGTEHEAPETHYAAVQYAQHMGDAIETLPPRCREAFLMNRFDGLSHEEIARAMGISRNMVAQHIMRALDVCRACDRRIRA